MRLNKTIRESVVEKAMKQAFSERRAALEEKRTALADALWEHEYGKHKAALKKVPDTFLSHSGRLRINAPGFHYNIGRGAHDTLQMSCTRPVPSSGWREIKVQAGHPLFDAAQAIANEHAAIQDEARELRAQLEAVTNSATTVTRLVKIWPEVVEFLPDAAQRVGERAIVPVEMINQINAKIGVSSPKRLDGVRENPFEEK